MVFCPWIILKVNLILHSEYAEKQQYLHTQLIQNYKQILKFFWNVSYFF